MQTVIEAVY